MEANTHPFLHKAFSTFTALALVLLMVPMAPYAAVADPASATDFPVLATDSETGLAVELAYDRYGDNGTVLQTIDSAAFAVNDAKAPDALDGSMKQALKDDLNQTAALQDAAREAAEEAMQESADENLASQFNAAGDNAVKTAVTQAMADWVRGKDGQDAIKKAIAEEANINLDDITEVAPKESGSGIVYAIPAGSEFKAENVTLSDASATEGTVDITGVTGVMSDNVKLAADNGVSVASGGSVAISDVDASAQTYSIQAVAAGSSTVDLNLVYDTKATDYDFAFDGSYLFKFNSFKSKDWTFTQDYTYTVNDEVREASSLVVTGAEVSGSFSDNEVTGALSAVSGTAKERAVALTTDDEATQSYTVKVFSVFPEGSDKITDTAAISNPITYGSGVDTVVPFENVVFAGGASASGQETARKYALERLDDMTAESDYLTITAAAGNASLTVQGKKQTHGESQGSTVTWHYGDLTAVQTITATVAPYELPISDIDLPFASKSDIEENALERANDSLRDAAVFDNDLPDYYSSVSLSDFDANGTGGQEFAPETNAQWTVSDEAATAYDNYVVTSAPKVTVAGIKKSTWSDVPALKLKSNVDLTASNADAQWVRVAPIASYEGHDLAYAPADGTLADANAFHSEQQLDAGDGTHAVEVYARDNATGEIARITGVSYMLDTLPPVLLNFEASGVRKSGGVFFGTNTVDVKLGIADLAEDAGRVNEAVSELDESSIAVTYHDDESNSDVSVSNGSYASSQYAFTVNSNQDVPANSIHVTAQDYAGNVLDTTADQNREIPGDIVRLVAEGDAPELSVSWENNDVRSGKYYAADRVLNITVKDHFFNYIKDYLNDQVVASVYMNGSDEPSIVVHPSDFTETGSNSNEWTYRLAFTAEADWVVSGISIQDVVGHGASARGDSFTIDKTTPTLDVAFDNENASNGNYYNAPRTATLTVVEHNFDSSLVSVDPTANAGNGDSVGAPDVSGWTNEGDVHTATVSFPGEGAYTLSVSGSDLAGLDIPSYASSEFIIDTTAPQIQISGVDNRQAYSGSAQPSVTVQDTNVSDATTIELSKISYPMSGEDANPYSESRSNATTEITASYPDAAQLVANDGVYTLTVSAVDLAGNTADQAVTWSVNRFGSTYVVSDVTSKMLNSYLQGSKVDNVVVTEINPSGLNEAATAVELTHDTSNSTLKSGSDYTVRSGDSSGWSEYTYTVSKNNFGNDGSYRVLFHSQDNASNTSENTMKNKSADRTATAEVAFAVDNTAPIVSYVDLAQGGLYEESVHTAQVNIQDNLKLDAATIEVDGAVVSELGASELADSSVHSFDVPESSDAHEVVVKAYDAAGNLETATVSGVTVTTDPVKLWMNNTPLFAGTIVGGVAVVGGVAAFFVLRFRRLGL